MEGTLTMAAPATNSKATCPECGASLSATMRHCPTCRSDAGAPNVRRCRTDENLKALVARFDDAKARTSANNCEKEFSDLADMVEKKSGVIVAMPAQLAMALLQDPNLLYMNYEELVGANVRMPADFDNDRQRCGTVGVLFGTYGKHITYGALSLTEEGLPTYGDVHCRLRSVTIDKRTSFLETNSYRFVREHSIIPGDKLPAGYMACWQNRHILVLTKLADRLSTGQTESDWQALLIQSDGKNRQNDDFVEAQIYENFNRNAIESMVATTGKTLKKADKMFFKLAVSEFKRLGGTTK